jgi:hypothetical protein
MKNEIYLPKITLYPEPSVGDPAHIVLYSVPDTVTKGNLPIQFNGTRFQRLLVKLLAWSTRRQLSKTREMLELDKSMCGFL